MKKNLLLLLAISVVALVSGCATAQLNSDVLPEAKLQDLKTIYVVHLPNDQRSVNLLITDRLKAMGMQASSGPESRVPADVDAVVTYQDKWMWDITMYMIELNVQVRKPGSGIALASGHSLRTSLVRKSPANMVAEVLDDIFKKR